ncbi:MAG: HAD family hydrolase [Phycisphaerae bacterium]
MDALIFDFDGVVVDSEPVHLWGFQQVLAGLGVELSQRDYYEKYLGFDDHDCLAAALTAAGMRYSETLLQELTEQKTRLVQKAYRESIRPLGGAVELIRAAAEAAVALAVCSGALRKEIELASRTIGVWDRFSAVVSAEDVSKGKPDPEGYVLALQRLEEKLGRGFAPTDCVVVEDSPAGIQAAVAAGLHVLAVTNSYTHESLQGADMVVDSLEEVSLADLDQLAESRD